MLSKNIVGRTNSLFYEIRKTDIKKKVLQLKKSDHDE